MKIKINEDCKKELDKRKIDQTDIYKGVIWDFLEEKIELSGETKKRIKK